jgi:hypothetical protein
MHVMNSIRQLRPTSGASLCRSGFATRTRRGSTTQLIDKQLLKSPAPAHQPLHTSKRPNTRGTLGEALLHLLRRLDLLLVITAVACLLPYSSLRLQTLLSPPLLHTLNFNGYGVNPRPLSMARVYADVNANMPRSYWDYDSVNISWGVLENYEVVRKIGEYSMPPPPYNIRAQH